MKKKQHTVTGFVSFGFTVCWLTLNRSLFRFYYIWHCLLTRHGFVQCSSTCTLGLSGSIILVQWLLTLNKSPFQYVYFSLGYCVFALFQIKVFIFWILCRVCSHIIGVHLSSDQVTYGFMMDADLYNSFLLRLRIKSFQQPSVCISL